MNCSKDKKRGLKTQLLQKTPLILVNLFPSWKFKPGLADWGGVLSQWPGDWNPLCCLTPRSTQANSGLARLQNRQGFSSWTDRCLPAGRSLSSSWSVSSALKSGGQERCLENLHERPESLVKWMRRSWARLPRVELTGVWDVESSVWKLHFRALQRTVTVDTQKIWKCALVAVSLSVSLAIFLVMNFPDNYSLQAAVLPCKLFRPKLVPSPSERWTDWPTEPMGKALPPAL